MSLKQQISYGIALVIGLFFSIFALFHLIVGFLKNPLNFFSTKKREVPPKCLTDKELGTHGFIHLEEVRLHYVAAGQEGKPLMLLVHGFPEFWYSWRFQLKEFSKDYRVVAIDQRGYGESDKPSGVINYKIDKLAADIKQLVPALGYRSCILAGHDWGGAVCWNVATEYPEIIDKLIILNCPHGGAFQKYVRTSWTQFKKSWYMFYFQIPWIPDIIFRTCDFKFLDAMAENSGKPQMSTRNVTREDVEGYKYSFGQPGCITAAVNYYRAAMRYQNLDTDKGNKIEKPTFIIWGLNDSALGKELVPLSLEYTTDGKCSYIEGANHFVQMDAYKEVNMKMRDFLKEK